MLYSLLFFATLILSGLLLQLSVKRASDHDLGRLHGYFFGMWVAYVFYEQAMLAAGMDIRIDLMFLWPWLGFMTIVYAYKLFRILSRRERAPASPEERDPGDPDAPRET